MKEAPTTPRRFAKLPTYDTGRWRVAVVYAQALVGAAEAAKALEAVLQEIDSLIDDVLDGVPKLEAVLSSAFVDENVKAAMLQKAFGNRASQVFLNFLNVVAKHGRLDMLRLIHLAFHEEYNQAKHRVRVLVSTATPLDKAAESRIAEEIHKRLQLQPVLEQQIRPELIAGIVLRIGDRVWDASVATQLERLREKMLNRSVHEIQSRRDRFSTPN